jgi:predicted MFS family arabinose efflux permease
MIFSYLTRFIKFKKLLFWSVLLGGIFTFEALIYLLPFVKENLFLAKTIAVIDSIIFGALGMIFFLTMLTFAAQKTDPKLAGSIFAFITSVMNLGMMGSSALGGWLYEKIG